MKTSDKGAAFIAVLEGIVTRAYRDVAGVWTIGVGHTASAGPPAPTAGMTLTRQEALDLLAGDLAKYEARVTRILPGAVQTVFDGAVSFDFNTGAIERARWPTLYRGGDLAGARTSLLQWTKTAGRTLAGLVKRRNAEAALIFRGDYGRIDGSILATADAPSASSSKDEIEQYQGQLAALGFYRGTIDGIAGPVTRAAVLAYQRSHPDLVADGIVGPATRASLARDLAARASGAIVAAGAAASAATTAAGAALSGAGHPLLIAAAVGAIVLALGIVLLARRYGGELRRLFTLREENDE